MLESLLVSGGCLRKNGFELGEGKYYDKARLLKVNLLTGKTEILLSKESGGKHYPEEHPNLQFTAGCVDGGFIWLPTDTEIYKLSYPDLKVIKIISHPFFHNIHSVHIIDQQLIVTSTGLDLVAFLTLDGEILRLANTEGKPVWHRFSEAIDYRLCYSTRPHDCHPNYVFKLDESFWVTRCKQQDAINLDNPGQHIPLTEPENRVSVHDGIVRKDKIYFTSVDGVIIVIDRATGVISEEINLIGIMDSDKLGWARGLHIDAEDIAYVAFSRLRRTRLKEKLAWAAKGELVKMAGMPACIIALDLKTRQVLSKTNVGKSVIDAIYNVMPEPLNKNAVAS